MIRSIEFNENEIAKENILGKGYSDSKIINNKVTRVYNTETIINIISENPGIKVYSTWGKGSNLTEWETETRKIKNLINLVSPSMAAKVPKGSEKYKYMLSDWQSKITVE
jgi:hypothetical protein